MVREQTEVESDDSVEDLAEVAVRHEEEMDSSSVFSSIVEAFKLYNIQDVGGCGEIVDVEYEGDEVSFVIRVDGDEFESECLEIGSEELQEFVSVSSAGSVERLLNERVPVFYRSGWNVDFPVNGFDVFYYRRRLMLRLGLFLQSKQFRNNSGGDILALNNAMFKAQPTIVGCIISCFFWGFIMFLAGKVGFVVLLLVAGSMFLKSGFVLLLFIVSVINYVFSS